MAEQIIRNVFRDLPHQRHESIVPQPLQPSLGNLNEMTIGQGSQVFRVDPRRGMFLGGSTFDEANFAVSMAGEMYLARVLQLMRAQDTANAMLERYSDFEFFVDAANIGFVANGTATASTTYSYSGLKSLKMVASNNDNYMYLGTSATNYNVPVKASTPYVMSAFFRTATSTATAAMFVRHNADASHESMTPFTVTDAWTRFYWSFNTLAGDTLLLPRFDNDVSGKTIYIDCVQIEEAANGATAPSGYKVPSAHTQINANSITTGKLQSTDGKTYFDLDNKQIIVNDGSNDRILIGYQSGGF